VGVLGAVGLYILVSIFSSGTESDARWKILAIAVGAAVLQSIVIRRVPTLFGVLVAIAMSLGLVVAGLIFWCGVERRPALKIAGSYFGLCILVSVVTAFI
jgi:hypothetical protein